MKYQGEKGCPLLAGKNFCREEGEGEWEMTETWQERLNIQYGMSKEEALENLRIWREKMKTCQRCECDKHVQFCPIHLICEESNNERNVEGDDNRGRIAQINEPEDLRTELSQARKRASIR